ncbi:hypothetical protein CL617_03345 [archaeon]|nr:hypothetical protein [archaeon]|tara:strand:+ start:1245 stop:1856 length:612 start_codon:yes stop_codon:yes gene_type:complete
MKSSFLYSVIDSIFVNSNIFNSFRNLIHSNFRDEKNAVKRNLNTNIKTLDFGCGAGQFSPLFYSKEYYGVDVDEKYIDFCKKKRKGNFSQIPTSPPYSFNEKFFDQILLSAVIHHINKKTLTTISQELKRILKDNGKLMILDHFRIEKQRNIFCKFLVYLDRGNFFRNPEEVINIFSEDFKVERKQLFKNSMYKDYVLIFSKK